ncbi:hypothetical protein ASZ90_019647 [hydrocarbon metagenome]|uniref:Uncharacterized protein n=1 Tax=hydrocarbon metagenome TaxID=938273 RepID=A0A0W8E2W1_9ZZZZ
MAGSYYTCNVKAESEYLTLVDPQPGAEQLRKRSVSVYE